MIWIYGAFFTLWILGFAWIEIDYRIKQKKIDEWRDREMEKLK